MRVPAPVREGGCRTRAALTRGEGATRGLGKRRWERIRGMGTVAERAAVPVNTILVGDALETLRRLPSESVHCVLTSPPYWGLRDYGVKGQIGLEATPEEFIARLVEVFREVRRVLRSDGVAWVNMGDCYATGAGAVGECSGGGEQGGRWRGDVDRLRDDKRGYRGERLANGRGDCLARNKGNRGATHAMGPMTQPNRMPIPGLKPKDLVGQPWRLAFALQADGWWLRCDCIWAKPNPMPESVSDRPTKAHEYIFLLSKSERYFYDAEAVKEASETPNIKKWTDNGSDKQRGHGRRHAGFNGRYAERLALSGVPPTRNLRSVWSIATQPFPEAHFATFPEALAARCILAGTSEYGACEECGAPWERVVSVSYDNPGKRQTNGPRSTTRRHEEFGTAGYQVRLERRSETTGWAPTCPHKEAEIAPCVVLDPFMGAGTSALVALKAGRRFIGIELNPSYAAMARRRIEPELVQGRLA